MYAQSFLTTSVRGSGFSPTTSASTADGVSSFMNAAFGFRFAGAAAFFAGAFFAGAAVVFFAAIRFESPPLQGTLRGFVHKADVARCSTAAEGKTAPWVISPSERGLFLLWNLLACVVSPSGNLLGAARRKRVIDARGKTRPSAEERRWRAARARSLAGSDGCGTMHLSADPCRSAAA